MLRLISEERMLTAWLTPASPPSAAVLERRTPTVMKMGWDSLAVMVLFAGGVVLLYAVE
jgi:predicted NAD-dependent protein-ADP-ribosyltransferase YbiA (DUF1768 family)